MAMSQRLQNYLDQYGIRYDLVEHDHTMSSMEAARKAHIPGDRLAKAVVLEDHRGYLMAVVPATRKVSLVSLRAQCGERLSLATEPELRNLFDDCEYGAIPAVGGAYGMEMVWDDSLAACDDIYFEAGDHTDLVHVSGADFRRLMGNAEHGEFSHKSASH